MALKEEMEKQGNWLFKYRSYLPLAILTIGLIFFVWQELYVRKTTVNSSFFEKYYLYLALSISLIGFFIRVYTVGYSARGTSGRNTKDGQVAISLNTTGIYSLVRHPLYLGNFLMWLGVAFLIADIWFTIIFILLFWINYERIMFAEEQFLRKKFGDDYLNWSKDVPLFIPKLRGFQKS